MVATVALLAACDGTSPPAPTGTVAPTTTAPETMPVTGTVGAALAFAGLEVSVPFPPEDPADPLGAVALPDPGTRYVRVVLRAVNPSDRARSFTPVAQATMIDGDGAGYPVTPGLYPDDLAGADVPAGESLEGRVSFILPGASVPWLLVLTDLQGFTTTVELQ